MTTCCVRNHPFLAVFLTVISYASAQAEPIELNGLNVPCETCAVRPDGLCEVPTGEGRSLMTCGEGAVRLLTGYAESMKYPEQLTSELLRGFLFNKDTTALQARPVIELLCRRADGQGMLMANAPLLGARYDQLWSEIVLDGKCPTSVWLRYFELPRRDGIPISAKLRTVIAVRSGKLGLGELFAGLSVTDLVQDRSELQSIAKELRELNSSWVGDVLDTLARLDSCTKILEEGVVAQPCSLPEIGTLPAYEAKYIQQLQVQQVIARSEKTKKDNQSDPEKLLQLVSQTNYREYRTPDLHRVVFEIVKSLDLNQFSRLIKADTYRDLLLTFGRNDQEIGHRLAVMLGNCAEIRIREAETVASGEMLRGEILHGEAADLLELSLKLSGGVMESRDRMIRELQNTGATKDRKLVSDRARELEASAVEARDESGALLLVMLVVLVSIASGFIGYSIYRRSVTGCSEDREILLSDEQRQELRELCDYFGLPPFSSESELSRIYRGRAKEMHPDLGGDVKEFAVLNENYRRAVELMTLRK